MAVLLFQDESQRKRASVVLLDSIDGSTRWGPLDYGDVHGEGTDLAVSLDQSTIVITGYVMPRTDASKL